MRKVLRFFGSVVFKDWPHFEAFSLIFFLPYIFFTFKPEAKGDAEFVAFIAFIFFLCLALIIISIRRFFREEERRNMLQNT